MDKGWNEDDAGRIDDGYPRSRVGAWAESSLWLVGMGSAAFGAALLAEWALVVALG
jgi:hypothetical protein